MPPHSALAAALLAPGPAPEHVDRLMLYGQFVGDWEGEGLSHQPDGSVQCHWWRMHFGWVLEGRAVQDVWMTPPRSGAHAGESARSGEFSDQYGTTLRLYDPASDSWQVTWLDPRNGYSARLSARLHDGDIVQEGQGSNGTHVRWTFSHIRADAFHWHAEVSRDQGVSWFRILDIEAHRI